MTREEAISVLKNTAWIGTDKKVGEVEKAIMMAIEALKAQIDKDIDVPNTNCISRLSAIDALYKEIIKRRLLDDVNDGMLDEFDTEDILRKLPSAQPIIRCKDCKFYTPMNRETKTGICRLLMHQNFGDDWYCAGAERRTDGVDS